MEKDVFTFDEQADTEILCLQDSPFAETRFTVDFSFCESPVCRCQTVHFSCLPLDDAAGALAKPLAFTLDLEEKKLTSVANRRPLPDALSLGNAMIAEMSEADWDLLQDKFRIYKERRTEEADYTALDAPFPEDVYIKPNTLVAATKVLPWVKPFIFQLGQDVWVMYDLYCCNPDCDCEEAIASFCRFGEVEGGAIDIVHTMPAASVNTRKGTIAPLESSWNEEPALETLFQAILQVEPDIVEKLEKRHRNLRLLYKNACDTIYKSSSLLPQQPFTKDVPVTEPRPNRPKPNDPCSCGSEKKYKKCCGRFV